MQLNEHKKYSQKYYATSCIHKICLLVWPFFKAPPTFGLIEVNTVSTSERPVMRFLVAAVCMLFVGPFVSDKELPFQGVAQLGLNKHSTFAA
jgi:hypothetical protein